MNSTFKIKDVSITWFGHASFMLEFQEERVYIDPFVLPETGNWKPATLVIHTHDHYDHCANYEALAGEGVQIYGSCKHTSNKAGDTLKVREIGLEFVEAYNPEKQFHPKGSGTGVIIELGGIRIYHAGDTEYIPEMAEVKCSVALLPIGGTYTMDIEQAVKAVELIKPKVVIPMHYNYIDGTNADPAEFANLVKERAPGTEVVILEQTKGED
jgi:L-ascorbate metabolism protein UlaG (beta-lactamase superfamily)